MKMIKFRPELFWDVDVKTLDPKKHARYIIERILDFGNDDEVRWVYYDYSHAEIKTVINTSRGIMPATKALWNNVIPD